MTAATTAAIRKSIFVHATPERAFALFTEGIATWWPLHRYGVYDAEAEGVAFENDALVEHGSGGRTSTWGEVLAWEPPSRLVLAWHPGRSAEEMPTEVEVRFSADGEGTRVDLEHRGWERLDEERRVRRVNYDRGWPEVLGHFQEGVEAA